MRERGGRSGKGWRGGNKRGGRGGAGRERESRVEGRVLGSVDEESVWGEEDVFKSRYRRRKRREERDDEGERGREERN